MFADKLRQHRVIIYVRRGGPNYQEGLRKFEEAGIVKKAKKFNKLFF